MSGVILYNWKSSISDRCLQLYGEERFKHVSEVKRKLGTIDFLKETQRYIEKIRHPEIYRPPSPKKPIFPIQQVKSEPVLKEQKYTYKFPQGKIKKTTSKPPKKIPQTALRPIILKKKQNQKPILKSTGKLILPSTAKFTSQTLKLTLPQKQDFIKKFKSGQIYTEEPLKQLKSPTDLVHHEIPENIMKFIDYQLEAPPTTEELFLKYLRSKRSQMDDFQLHYNLTLKPSQEARLQQIFQSYSMPEGLDLYAFIMLNIQKNIISNTCSFKMLLTIFKQALGETKFLNRKRFYFAMNSLARELFENEIRPLEEMLTQILVDPLVDSEQSILPVHDGISQVLLTEDAIQVLCGCQQGLLQVLMLYNTENIENRRKVIGVKAVKSNNTGITARNFLRYCRAALIVPHLVNIETFQQVISQTIPPIDRDSSAYYDKYILIKEYELDYNYFKMIPYQDISGQPIIKMFQLQLILARIAILGLNDLQDPIEKIQTLMVQKLRLGPGMEPGPGCQIKYDTDYISDASFGSIEQDQVIVADYNRKQMLSQKGGTQQTDLTQVIKVLPTIPNLKQIENMMQNQHFPELPQIPYREKVNPPPYNIPPVQFPLPKPVDPKAPKPSPRRPMPQRGKKKESAADLLKFAPIPGSMPKIPQHERDLKMKEIRDNLNSNLYESTAKSMLSNPAIQPCIIRQVLLPPDSPPVVSALIQSALVYQNSGNYPMAIISLEDAKGKWTEQEKGQLKPENSLFFEISKASIFQSCGKDELALAYFYQSKEFSDKLIYNHPDKALFYCGISSALCHLGQYSLALRGFLAAKELRQRVTGPDTVDTASVYNNIGVCYQFLGRFQEALAHFQLAEAILDMWLGPHHPRTITAKKNIHKARRETFLPEPEFQPLWKKEFVDPFPKGKKKGKGRKKKKGRR